MPAIPLPTDGVVGKLNPTQQLKLKETWRELFRLTDEAPRIGSGVVEKLEAPGPSPKSDVEKAAYNEAIETAATKAALVQCGSEALLACFWRFVAMDNPDSIVLRFLRARKWSPSAGVAMLVSCIGWRLSSDVEKIFEKGEEGMQHEDGFIRQMQMGKAFTHGTDRYGRPIVVIHVAKHLAADQNPKALEDFVLFQMESVRCLLAPPVDKIVLLFDMTGFRLKNMDWRCLLFIVKCLEAYYPESLSVILVHSAPWIFQGIWKLLAPMLDPVVRAKVEMTKSAEDLIAHIPRNHLIQELGGSSAWKWEYPPVIPGENDQQKDLEGRRKAQASRQVLLADYETITRQWSATVDDDPLILMKRELAALRLRSQYFLLDQFIRGRGVFTRNGNIVGNGLVFFEYPGEDGGEDEWEVLGEATCRERCLQDIRKLSFKIGEFELGL